MRGIDGERRAGTRYEGREGGKEGGRAYGVKGEEFRNNFTFSYTFQGGREGGREGGRANRESEAGKMMLTLFLSSLSTLFVGYSVIMASDATAAHTEEDQRAAQQVWREGGREGGRNKWKQACLSRQERTEAPLFSPLSPSLPSTVLRPSRPRLRHRLPAQPDLPLLPSLPPSLLLPPAHLCLTDGGQPCVWRLYIACVS